MATKTLITPMDGTPKQIVLADHATDFPATITSTTDLRTTDDGTFETEVQLDLTDVGNTAARQSAKWDFGTNWAQQYHIRAAFEMAATGLTAGDLIELYFCWSHHSTAGTGNLANLSGTDSAYTGYSANLGDSVKQLVGPYIFICTGQATTTVQVANVGVIFPRSRYGICVVKNESGAAFHSDAVESHIVLDPVVPESQEA